MATEAGSVGDRAVSAAGSATEFRASNAYRNYVVWLLFVIYVFNYVDRQILSIVLEPIKQEFGLHDWQLGMLSGLAFALWLWQQSVFELGLVCPWCFLVWLAMYAMAFPLWTWALGSGGLPGPAGLRRTAARFSSWGWVLSLALAVILVLTIMIVLPGIPRYLFAF